MVFHPALDLATYVAANVAGATLGTNCFYGPIRSPEDGAAVKSVFFIEGGGPSARPDNGTVLRTVFANVQVWVRGDGQDYNGGKTWADLIFDAVEHAPVAGYINVRNTRAKPSYVSMDSRAYHEWSWDVEMIFEE